MGTQYGQLTTSEREMIGRLHAADRSRREIARTLTRCASTIGREIRRNGRPTKRWTGGHKARLGESHGLPIRELPHKPIEVDDAGLTRFLRDNAILGLAGTQSISSVP